MSQHKILTGFLIIVLSLVVRSGFVGAECDPGTALSRAEWKSHGKVETVVLVGPFINQSKETVEDWLTIGLAEVLGDLLQTGKNVGVEHGLTRLYPQTTATPQLVVSGSFQRTPDELRVFVKVFKGTESMPIYDDAFTITPPDSGKLFVQMGRVAGEIFSAAKIKPDKERFIWEKGATSDYLAFQAYTKGLEAMWKFDPNYIDVAAIWFQEARKHDIYFLKSYIAEENLYGYLTMKAKVEEKQYSYYLEKLETLENARIRYSIRPSPISPEKPKVMKKKDIEIANRYLVANAHYLAGMAALRGGNLKDAEKELSVAVELVPEDTIAARELYNVYLELKKDKDAQRVLQGMSIYGLCR